MSEHTPTPWEQLHRTVCSKQFGVSLAVTQAVAGGRGFATDPINHVVVDEAQAVANARFIVRACNAHDALVEALLECYDVMLRSEIHNWPPGWKAKDQAKAKAEAALKLAESPTAEKVKK